MPDHLTRRAFGGGLAASAGLMTPPFGASAQTYPGRRISVIIPTSFAVCYPEAPLDPVGTVGQGLCRLARSGPEFRIGPVALEDQPGRAPRCGDHRLDLQWVTEDHSAPGSPDCAHGGLWRCLPCLINQQPADLARPNPLKHAPDRGEGRRDYRHQ